jgi:multidrug resistance efflux pump
MIEFLSACSVEGPKRRIREGGGSEWEPIKILSQKNSAYIPIATLSHTQTSLDTLRTKLERPRSKEEANTKELEQSTKKAETYRVNRHK